ncbi:MAG: DUF3299 domain-containing protein [Caulobacter sp.]|nr:DUF3299 domain-containing protein [Caulobacter sp.]
MNRLAFLVLFLSLSACGPAPGPADQAVAEPPPPKFDQIPLNRADEITPAESDPMAQEMAMERQAQLDLPMVRGGLWDTLRTTRISIDEQSQLYQASHADAVRRLAGTRIKLRGYMLPLATDERTRHFLISPYTPVCFFHPPAQPNEVVEVRLGRAITAGYHLVEVTGVLRLANDGEKGLFFVLDDAKGRIVERVG